MSGNEKPRLRIYVLQNSPIVSFAEMYAQNILQLVARHRTLIAEKQSLSAELDSVTAERNTMADEARKAKESLRLLQVSKSNEMEAYARRLEAKMKTIDDLNHQLGRGGAGSGGSTNNDKSGSRGIGASRAMGPNAALNQSPANRTHNAARAAAAMPQEQLLLDQADEQRDSSKYSKTNDGGADRRGTGPAGGLDPAAGAKDLESNPPIRPPHAMSIGDKIAEIERYEDFLKSESQKPPHRSGVLADRQEKFGGRNGENLPVEDLGALQNQIEQMWNDDDDDDEAGGGNAVGAGEIGDFEYGRPGNASYGIDSRQPRRAASSDDRFRQSVGFMFFVLVFVEDFVSSNPIVERRST